MARPLPRSALEGAGFTLANSSFNGSGDRTGVAMRHHYTLTRPFGNTTVTHHAYVDTFGDESKPDVYYHVTHAGQPFAEGRLDTLRRHRDNIIGGTKDPIGEILAHHRWADAALRQQTPQPLTKVTPENVHALSPDWPAHVQGGGLESEIRQGPDLRNRMQSLNAVEDRPLDAEVYRVLTSGTGGNRFLYQGRFPGDEGTDLYQIEHPDPRSPDTFRYGFTVRHRPGETKPFSYNAMRYQNDTGPNGEEDPGSFLDVTGNTEHVANLGTLAQLVRRHEDMLKALGIKTKGVRPRKSSVDEEFENIIRFARLMDQADEDLRP